MSIAQALIVRGNRALMVRERVDSGDIVWNFPGGSINENETPEQACIREIREETGYDVAIVKLYHEKNGRYTYLAEITGGELTLEEGILELAWVDPCDDSYFDGVTAPIRELFLPRKSAFAGP